MTTIKNNTTNLQSLLEQVNNLPEAGSDSGIGTCTVTLSCFKNTSVFYYIDPTNNNTISSITASSEVKTIICLTNSLIIGYIPNLSYLHTTNIADACSIDNQFKCQVFLTPSIPGSTSSITNRPMGSGGAE